jgi:adenylate cyclase
MLKESRRLIYILGIGLLSALFMVFFLNMIIFENIEHRMTDFKFSMRGTEWERLDGSQVVIVAIDDQSFAQIPYKYPWPRTYHATLVKNLNKAGVNTILFDVEFTEESAIDPEQDDIFRNAILEAGNVVLAGKMSVQDREGFTMVSLLPPIKKLREAAPFGIADTKFDTDGFVRRYILFRDYNENRYFSLGLSALIKYLGLEGDHQNWFREINNGNYILGDTYTVKKYESLPSTFINYYGPAYSFRMISYEQVVDEEGLELLLDSGILQDKIVLVGATVSELHDAFSTPFYVAGQETLTPGVEIHANFIQSVWV